MKFWRQLGLSDAAAAVLVILVSIFGIGGWLLSEGARQGASDPPEISQIDQTVADTVADVVEEQVVDEPEPPQVSEAVEDDVQIAAIPQPKDPVPTAPKLDLVRVSPDGDAVVAGIADPRATIVFLVNGIEVARASADSTGSFVGLFDIPVSDQPSSITVAAEGGDGALISDESIFVAAIAAPEPEPVVEEIIIAAVPEVEPETVIPVVPEPDDVKSVPKPAEADESPNVKTEPARDATPVIVQDTVAALDPIIADEDAAPFVSTAAANPVPVVREAPTIVVASSQGVKVLQTAAQPKAPTAEPAANVVIDTITYDTEGAVALVGRGRGEGFVRIYLNDKPILTVPIEADGSWETPLADVDAGVYQLRVDEITAEGAVTSRVETPFQREEVALAADAPPTAITVQPGSTLWAIAKDQLGDGVEYVRVYEANRALIRNPDLIYPGQVFALPDQ